MAPISGNGEFKYCHLRDDLNRRKVGERLPREIPRKLDDAFAPLFTPEIPSVAFSKLAQVERQNITPFSAD